MSDLKVCLICDTLASIAILGACTYVVFWLNQPGWWYLLAIVLCSCWDCKRYRSPEQMAADPEKKCEFETSLSER